MKKLTSEEFESLSTSIAMDSFSDLGNVEAEIFESEDGVTNLILQNKTDPNTYILYSGKAAEAVIEAVETMMAEVCKEESEEE